MRQRQDISSPTTEFSIGRRSDNTGVRGLMYLSTERAGGVSTKASFFHPSSFVQNRFLVTANLAGKTKTPHCCEDDRSGLTSRMRWPCSSRGIYADEQTTYCRKESRKSPQDHVRGNVTSNAASWTLSRSAALAMRSKCRLSADLSKVSWLFSLSGGGALV